MPTVNWGKVPDGQGYEPLPDGDYLCEISEIDSDRQTKKGDEMWSLKLKVVNGDYAGRLMFDNMIFSEKGLSRVKFITSRLGMDTDNFGSEVNDVDLNPIDYIGKQAVITTYREEYPKTDGGTGWKNSIPWDGYKDASAPKSEEPVDGIVKGGGSIGNMPFDTPDQ